MKHPMNPTSIQNTAMDRNDTEKAKTAIELEWPETFSRRAKMVLRYFGNTAFLYSYDNHMVVTDESRELTDFGDGSKEAPIGFPRFEGKTLEDVEAWLEAVADDFDAENDCEHWRIIKREFEG